MMGVAYNPKVVTNGLVLALDAVNQKSYPGSGTTWFDLTGRGNNGVLTNGVEPVKQNSIVLDGSGDFLTLTNLNATYLSNDFCIESWVYVTSQANQTLFNTIPHASFDINLNRGGSGQTALYIGNGSGWQTLDFRSSGTLTANQWHHIAVTRNSNVITIWHNGISQGSTSAYMPTGFGTSAYIGTYDGGTGENVNGKIYGYRIVSGSPVYTQTFTPPIRVSNISGTQLIVAQDGGFINSAQTSVVATPSGNTYANNDSGHMKFDGVDDYVVLPSGADYETANVTFEAWVNLQDRSNRHIVMLRWSGLSLEVNANRTVVMYNLSSEGQQGAFTTTRQITFNQWSQIVGTYDATSKDLKTYIDGELGATRTNTQNTTYSVGVNKISGNDYGGTVLGNVAAVRQYNRALSASEIQQNFNATRGRYGI